MKISAKPKEDFKNVNLRLRKTLAAEAAAYAASKNMKLAELLDMLLTNQIEGDHEYKGKTHATTGATR